MGLVRIWRWGGGGEGRQGEGRRVKGWLGWYRRVGWGLGVVLLGGLGRCCDRGEGVREERSVWGECGSVGAWGWRARGCKREGYRARWERRG